MWFADHLGLLWREWQTTLVFYFTNESTHTDRHPSQCGTFSLELFAVWIHCYSGYMCHRYLDIEVLFTVGIKHG